MARKPAPAKTPTVAVARALRALGLQQRGGAGRRDFSVTGQYNSAGERLYTLVILYSREANNTVARHADAIEAATDAEGFPFRVSVYNFNGRADCSISNSGPRVRQDVPGITDTTQEAEETPAPAAQEEPVPATAKPAAAPVTAPQRRTQYQMIHPATRRTEVLCTAQGRVVDRSGSWCTACGRLLQVDQAHKPNVDGSLGWVEHYADGSTRQLPPDAIASPRIPTGPGPEAAYDAVRRYLARHGVALSKTAPGGRRWSEGARVRTRASGGVVVGYTESHAALDSDGSTVARRLEEVRALLEQRWDVSGYGLGDLLVVQKQA